MTERSRLDEELVLRGFYKTRARARDAVKRSAVFVNGLTAHKPAQFVSREDKILVQDVTRAYVSRAAIKLVFALDQFGISVEDKFCLDIGCSTGGFTQVLLERGAAQVTAIDVGHGQMVPELARHSRVTLLEGLNARDLRVEIIGHPLDVIVSDVSFISLRLALPAALALAAAGTVLIALIKPQFEVGKGRNPHDPAEQQRVCGEVQVFLSEAGWDVIGMAPSPLKGGDGTQEFLIAARKP